MELFKFIPGSDPSYLEQGEGLNKLKTATWIERYVEAGEITITAPVSSGLRDFIPLGTLVSHTDTEEVMIIENAEIDEDVEEGEPEIVLTGRSLETWLENRIVGEDMEHYAGLVLNYEPYILAFDTSWVQARELIRLHINDATEITTGNIDGIVPIDNQQHIGTSTTSERLVNPTTVYAAVLELLAIDGFGIKTVRPNADNVDPLTTEIRIHNGVDRTASVIFSHIKGDLQKARYLWSNKSLKTDYYCVSTYLKARSDSASHGFNRRTMFVDCTDMDQAIDYADIGVDFDLGAAMYARGEMLLRNQQSKSILSTNVSKNSRYQFRKHYDVGDLVTVNGNYDISAIMRVTEHVEFLDENGESGYPTLSALNE